MDNAQHTKDNGMDIKKIESKIINGIEYAIYRIANTWTKKAQWSVVDETNRISHGVYATKTGAMHRLVTI